MILRKIVHYVAGFVTSILPPYLSFLTFLSFVLYEVFEYIKLRDTLYLEMREYAVGLYIGGVVHWILSLH